MADEYIKRSDAIEAIENRVTFRGADSFIGDAIKQACTSVIRFIPSADVQPVGCTLEECGNYLLFLWMENILTDAEYNRAINRFNKKMREYLIKTSCIVGEVTKEDIRDCSTCKHGFYDERFEHKMCHDPTKDCVDWNHWERKDGEA